MTAPNSPGQWEENLQWMVTTGGASDDANSANTFMGRLTKLRDIFLALTGQTTKANSLSVAIASDQATRANPLISQNAIKAYIDNGQGFSATTGKLTAGGAITGAFSLFNPSGSAKTIYLYAMKYCIGNNSFNQITLVTTDPALTAATAVNNKAANGTASIASVTYSNSTQTPSGTTFDMVGSATNTNTSLFANDEFLVVPPGNGAVIWTNISGANVWCVDAKWIEV
jgi:hypothetical protein